MAFIERSNNRILPANARAADVATRAVEEITPVQQQRYLAAFSVQGYQCILYSRLEGGGARCSCQSSRKIVNSILGKDGKASPGVVNEMLSGSSFTIRPYGSDNWKTQGYDSPQFPTADNSATETDQNLWVGQDPSTITSPLSPGNKHGGVFDIASKGGAYPNERVVDADGGFGDNGPVRGQDIDQIMNDWDSGIVTHNESGCPVCFGTGIVGGFAPLYGWRKVWTPDQVTMVDGELDVLERPWATTDNTQFTLVFTLPRGATALDTATLWHGNKKVAYRMTVNNVQVTDANVLQLCDGQPKVAQVTLLNGSTRWTHFELQFNLGSFQMSARFEYPKQPKSGDANKLERTLPFQIVMDPGVPQEVKTGDIITESVNGRSMVVGEVVPWNTRNRRLLGQELTVRVLQPTEYFNLLPRRGRVPTKDRTTDYLMDNVTGPRRT